MKRMHRRSVGLTRGRALAALAGMVALSGGAIAQDTADESRADRATTESEDSGGGTTLIERRAQLVEMADQTVEELKQKDANVSELYDEAYGYAVLDTTKGGLLVTGAGGTGVAKTKRGEKPIFMHVGGAGIGAGGGVANYKLVLFFEDEDTFDEFIDGDWQGGATAQASAGDKGVSTEEFFDGAAAYRIDENGLIAQAELEGMRFWPSDRLN